MISPITVKTLFQDFANQFQMKRIKKDMKRVPKYIRLLLILNMLLGKITVILMESKVLHFRGAFSILLHWLQILNLFYLALVMLVANLMMY